MDIIKEIRDFEVTGKNIPKSKKDYKMRLAARAIILDSKNNVALLSIPKLNYHKIPGGGLKEDEDIKKALKREIKEEVGCDIEIIKELGEIIEYRNKYGQKQISYCFLTRIKGNKGNPSYTKKEKEADFTLLWIPLDKAIELIEKDNPQDYILKFIKLRDYTFLLEAKKMLENSRLTE
jgi:8-oxo-dGTP diphosphatase